MSERGFTLAPGNEYFRNYGQPRERGLPFGRTTVTRDAPGTPFMNPELVPWRICPHFFNKIGFRKPGPLETTHIHL